MESHIIGHFPIHPLSSQAKKVFALKLLTPLAEYQEFLPFVFSEDVAGLLRDLVNVRKTGDARLAFEALRFMVALFCHKKFVMEWAVAGDGLRLLLAVPRPSIAATAVCQALYYIACEDDVMEKVCAMPSDVVAEVVRYVLWCMECSHESGRQFAAMFFGIACFFPAMLEAMDGQDGLRRLYNTVSTLKILTHHEESAALNLLMTEDEEFGQRQSLRHAMVAFKRYFEAHLAVRWEQQVRRVTGGGGLARPNPSKPLRLTPAQAVEAVDALMEHAPFRSRWPAVDGFVALGGVTTCLQVIAMAYDWTFPGRAEMVRSALDVLFICSVVPRVQLAFCDRIELHDDSKTVGINIILGAAEGEIVQVGCNSVF